jgi:hypothetical protein
MVGYKMANEAKTRQMPGVEGGRCPKLKEIAALPWSSA